MYIVHNTTNKTIMLADLRAEIKPKGVLDLEKVVSRSAIDSSRDLKNALHYKWLQLGKHSIIRTRAKSPPPQIVERRTIQRIEKEIDEDKLAALIRRVIQEESQGNKAPDIGEDLKGMVQGSIDTLISSIQDKLGSIQHQKEGEEVEEVVIDPAKFAEISQRAIEKISEDIETSGPKKPKKINIRNKNIQDLAGEL